MGKIHKKTKIYYVRWYRNGYNYRDTSECTWDDVLECKRQAKELGETIEYEYDYTKEETYYV